MHKKKKCKSKPKTPLGMACKLLCLPLAMLLIPLLCTGLCLLSLFVGMALPDILIMIFPEYKIEYSGSFSGEFEGGGYFTACATINDSLPHPRIELSRNNNTGYVILSLPPNARPGTYQFINTNTRGQDYTIHVSIKDDDQFYTYSRQELVEGTLTLKDFPQSHGERVRGSFKATLTDDYSGTTITIKGHFDFEDSGDSGFYCFTSP